MCTHTYTHVNKDKNIQTNGTEKKCSKITQTYSQPILKQGVKSSQRGKNLSSTMEPEEESKEHEIRVASHKLQILAQNTLSKFRIKTYKTVLGKHRVHREANFAKGIF